MSCVGGDISERTGATSAGEGGRRKGEVAQSPWTLTDRIFDEQRKQATPALHSPAEGEIHYIFSFGLTEAK